uniref:Microcystin dependent protein n=1 Tax=uncultured bacterium A1Q1_fos_500 TaxID=1256579 RepID=L7W0J9_9BACT|nr:microcystin dependent protein [uncultured bacterium A1Q1_fos_500]
MDAFLGTVLPVGFNYAPRGWVFCNGQLMGVQQNSALFALLGTMYGGDGRTTFGIPDLRGRVIVGSQQQGPGLQNVAQGQKAGTNTVTVSANGTASATIGVNNLPPHSHTANTKLTAGTATNGGVTPAAGNSLTATLSSAPTAAAIYTASPTNPVALGGISTTIESTGNGQPLSMPVATTANISIMPPYLGLNYIICTEGIFPSRN